MGAKPEAHGQWGFLAGTQVRDDGRGVAVGWVRSSCRWTYFEVADNRKIMNCYSGLPKVTLTFKVVATRSTVLLRGVHG